ncbi:TAP-like protein-domain-containing protein [Mycena filopes]|nr:TAP-like protein-domain-containing protein [Mycena filopes]
MISTSFLSLVTTGLIISSLNLPVTFAQEAPTFDWESLTATASLNWTSCYSGFQCSLLEVPLDYASDKGNGSIAIVRYPATAPKSEYLGPILFNPGGPGGSGVVTIVALGAEFAEIMGPQFDIVGFDPRGVSFSKPFVSFFKTAAERQIWTPSDLNLRYPSLNATSEVISNQWSQFQLIGQVGQQSDTEDVYQYITTDNVARDMLRITEAFGFEKLQYWGVSYGSLLGATFATLFPDKVGRIAIDGIMDADAWYSANLTDSLTDTDKTLQTFFDGCCGVEGPVGGNTSFPLLVIGNTADPVTPLMWARKAASRFPGSVLLTQDSPGHMSLVAPSLCTHGALRAYFQNGTLPAAGTVCAVDAELFPATNSNSSKSDATAVEARASTTEEERRLLDAVRAIGDVVRPIASSGRVRG